MTATVCKCCGVVKISRHFRVAVGLCCDGSCLICYAGLANKVVEEQHYDILLGQSMAELSRSPVQEPMDVHFEDRVTCKH